jgi:hypothetical protein
VVEDAIRDVRRDAHLRHAGDGGPTEVMEPPVGELGRGGIRVRALPGGLLAHDGQDGVVEPLPGPAETGVRRPPVVVNTKSPTVIRGSERISSTAAGDSGTWWAWSIFARSAGIVHIAAPRSSSDQRMPATSFSRWAVRSSSFTNGPKGQSRHSAASQTNLI